MLAIEPLETRSLLSTVWDLSLLAGLGRSSERQLLGQQPAVVTGIPAAGLLGTPAPQLAKVLTLPVHPATLPPFDPQAAAAVQWLLDRDHTA